MGMDPSLKPVTRAELARMWDGVRTMAVHVDELKKAYRILNDRMRAMDEAVGRMAKIVDALNPDKVDA